MAATVSFDTSQIKKLSKLIDDTRRKTSMVAPQVLTSAANRVFVDAVANAQGMADTGELASSTRIQRSDADGALLGFWIGADVRQAFFLEYGSPNTGAPRPWLSSPAMRGQIEALSAIQKAAGPW